MLTTDDKKEIRKMIGEEVEVRTDPLRGALVAIEQKIDAMRDIISVLKGHSEKLDNHEERISSLEPSSKF